ncbi:hypothetical protein ACIF9R_29445 [Streptomyces sp. NPDC086080]|uniref:hypothetical protein n=1 Tax=Streptomyces sp. NPDC086080 TaxID=3365748 RepID=UPI0037D06A71
MLDWISELVERRMREYAMDTDPAMSPAPKLHPPATGEEIHALEIHSGHQLTPEYRGFLLQSDGMENFCFHMPILGCRDWREATGEFRRAQEFCELIEDMETAADVGLPDSVRLMPVSVDVDVTQGIFMIDTKGAVPERFWWVGNGSSDLFHELSDIFKYAMNPGLYVQGQA